MHHRTFRRQQPKLTNLGMIPLLLIVALLVGMLCLEHRVQAAEKPSRPNVVLVMTDDQGNGDLGFHGNSMIKTPNLDRFARESVRLTNYHVCPTCSETRAALMTGRYASRTGVWHTIMGRSLLRADEVTLADLFSQNGYQTGVFGKWHLGDNFPFRVQDRGFTSSLVHGGGGVTQTPDYWGNDYFDDTYWRNGQPEQQEGYCTDVFFDAALDFIEQNQDQPFFCYLPTNAAHGPFLVEEKYSQPYLDQGVPQRMANFYGMITNIDDNMQRLLTRLDELSLAENTIVIFSTDNGTAAGYPRGKGNGWRGFNAGLRGAKGSQYEGGHRVPCFVRWPAQWMGDREIDTLAAHLDWLPTFQDICQLKWATDLDLDGHSLATLLSGGDSAPERTLFVQSQRIEQPQKYKKFVAMTQRWRLVDGKELYDMQSDRGQQQNVAEEHQQVVKRLMTDYEAWWKHISPRFDEYCRILIGHDAEPQVRITCHDWHGNQVPWNQGHIRQGPYWNGYWAIEVAQPGAYEFRLRRWPQQVAEGKLQANQAKLKVGQVEKQIKVADDASEAVFQMNLPAGPAKLQTWLTDDSGKTRGAYFVYVKRLPIDEIVPQEK